MGGARTDSEEHRRGQSTGKDARGQGDFGERGVFDKTASRIDGGESRNFCEIDLERAR